jgi:hypothetical protein
VHKASLETSYLFVPLGCHHQMGLTKTQIEQQTNKIPIHFKRKGPPSENKEKEHLV